MSGEDRFERELSNALRREAPPEGFAERVLARARMEPPVQQGGWQWATALMRLPAFRLVATAALFVAFVAGGIEYRQYRQERAAGAAAKQQLMLALRITGSKLQYAQQKVNDLNSEQYGPATEEKVQ